MGGTCRTTFETSIGKQLVVECFTFISITGNAQTDTRTNRLTDKQTGSQTDRQAEKRAEGPWRKGMTWLTVYLLCQLKKRHTKKPE